MDSSLLWGKRSSGLPSLPVARQPHRRGTARRALALACKTAVCCPCIDRLAEAAGGKPLRNAVDVGPARRLPGAAGATGPAVSGGAPRLRGRARIPEGTAAFRPPVLWTVS